MTQAPSTAPRTAAPHPDVRGWLSGTRFSWFAFVMIGLVILGVLVVAPTVRTFVVQQQQLAQLRQQLSAQQSQVDDLLQQVQDWQDPAYIEAQARDRLAYVLPGETAYLLKGVPRVSTAAPTGAVSDKAQQAPGDWTATLLQSLLGGSR
jgi:cell division protein FtsB